MIALNATVCCLAYILGLLLTGLPGSILGLPIGAIALLLGGVGGSVIQRFWKTEIRPRVWLLAGLCGCLAVLHFQIRLPQPSATDISRMATQVIQVEGTIASPPRLTRSQKVQFELEARSAGNPSQKVSGKVYVTVPRSQDSQLYPGRLVRVSGELYQPEATKNPGGFDFQQYLAQQGIFAGMSGRELEFLAERRPHDRATPPFLWSMQQRIIHAQALWINQNTGRVMSAIVMGRGGVDIPYDIQDRFARVGLAHALAASGTQVSLLAGIVLALTQRLNRWTRLGIGLGVLTMYVGLTGLEPSVLRAALMGAAVFLGVAIDRQVKPLSLLLVAATILLLWNPLWIWSLAFQLSFLATLGLMVTVPVLSKDLDWLPTRLIPLVAVPIAAYIWTLPLQLSVFGTVSPYCIFVNILTSIPIALISISGMASALLAFIHPLLGSASAWVVQFPTELFLKIAEAVDYLPGNALAIGSINATQVILLYGIYLLVWWQSRWQKHWWVAGAISLGIVLIPAAYMLTHLSQITVLSTTEDAVMVLQDRGKVGLINVGNEADVRFTVLPFLRQQGINRVDWAIAAQLDTSGIESFQKLLAAVPIGIFYASPDAKSDSEYTEAYRHLKQQIGTRKGIDLQLSNHQKIQVGGFSIELMAQPALFKMRVGQQNWIFVNHQPRNLKSLPQADILLWTGKNLPPALLEQVKPRAIVSSAAAIPAATAPWFKTHPTVRLYQTHKQGAVQWTKSGFKTMQ
jgi:competence protein ComEC